MRVLSYLECVYKKLGISRQTYNIPGFFAFYFLRLPWLFTLSFEFAGTGQYRL